MKTRKYFKWKVNEAIKCSKMWNRAITLFQDKFIGISLLIRKKERLKSNGLLMTKFEKSKIN